MDYSPFKELVDVSHEILHEKLPTPDEWEEKSPFVSFEDAEYQPNEERFTPGLLLPSVIGEAMFVPAITLEYSEEYKEPAPSGNPLLVITKQNRTQKVSPSFTVAEYARSELAGLKNWDHARIDPALVDNLERLRAFIWRSITIKDGFYSPAYLRKFLKLRDIATANKDRRYLGNPHLSGRGVRIAVSGFDQKLREIAAAVIAICDADIKLSIGASTMTMEVKPVIDNQLPEEAQRITSYITNEYQKQSVINFCIGLRRLLMPSGFAVYGRDLNRATAELVNRLLIKRYSANLGEIAWPNEIATAISMMYKVHPKPEVILYALAYSPFGGLARMYLSKESLVDIEVKIVAAVASPDEYSTWTRPETLLYLQRLPDKKRFIDTCVYRVKANPESDVPHHIVKKKFFDKFNNKGDKIFFEEMTNIIKQVFKDAGYNYDTATPDLPLGGTIRRLQEATPNPDNPLLDLTGKYESEYELAGSSEVGATLLINQAGKYVAGKFCVIANYNFPDASIFKRRVKNLREAVHEFYGTMDDSGIITGKLYPLKTIKIVKSETGKIVFAVFDDANDSPEKPIYSKLFNLVSPAASISVRMLDAFKNLKISNELILILGWVHPLQQQLKLFFNSLREKDKKVTGAIRNFYTDKTTQPSVRSTRLESYLNDVDSGLSFYYGLPKDKKLSNIYKPFFDYYLQLYFSRTKWKPAGDYDHMSKRDWIKRLLVDYRDAYGPMHPENTLYNSFGVDTQKPKTVYKYKIKLDLTSFGVGPFSRSSGTITIENNTVYTGIDGEIKWKAGTKITRDIVLWSAQVALSTSMLSPKFGSSTGLEGETESSAGYYESDFSEADVLVTEGSLIELPIKLESDLMEITTKTGISGIVIRITGKGKKPLEFTHEEFFDAPDSVDISIKGKGDKPSFLEYLPNLTMYTGSIDYKASGNDLSTLPLPGSFEASYHIEDTQYFKHDDSILLQGGIDAIGRLCSEERVALTDPSSTLEVYGYTDASGKEERNQTLSDLRAKNVMHAIRDRLGTKLRAKQTSKGLGEDDANKRFGQFTEKNAWLRRVVIIINGRTVLSVG